MATNYYLEKRTDKRGDAPIRVSISVQGARFITSIGYNINPSKWDNNRQKVKQGYSNSKGVTYTTINAHISEITAFFLRYENDVRLHKDPISKEQISLAWALNFKGAKRDPEASQTLLELFDTFIKEQGQANSWTLATVKRFRYMRKQIGDFNPAPTFESFNRSGLVEYVNYLHATKQLRNSTITKNLAFLRWFLRWAVENGHSTNSDFEKFRPKLKSIKSSDKRIIFLTWDELMRVYNYPIPQQKEYLQRVRDVFCFCCFTSLRYSDVQNLKRSDIVGDTLHITTVKTSDSLQIELNKYSKAILERYEAIPYEGDKALPVISNQRMNDYLKELGEMCGIDEPQTVVYFKGSERIEEVYPKYELLGTHAGRRTFICNALALGIPANVVMKWTGHSDYKAMKPYIDVADSIKAREMNKFNEV
ncbi:MAG: phage integrase SAM-like domain-containing protein [Rikenellaceae bacterium]